VALDRRSLRAGAGAVEPEKAGDAEAGARGVRREIARSASA
jgi:hypothetical protein